MTNYYVQINIQMYAALLSVLPAAHTYNGVTQQLVIIHSDDMETLDKAIAKVVYELD